MKTFSVAFTTLFLACAITFAQSAKEKQPAVEKKAADERTRSFGGVRTKNNAKKMVTVQPRGSAQGHVNQKGIGSNGDEQMENYNMAGTNSFKKELSAISDISTSEAGSPAILANDKGNGRDGTGNAQRGSYNMAGAQVPGGANLATQATTERNYNTGTQRIRKQEDQPAYVKEKTGSPSTDRKMKSPEQSGNKNPGNQAGKSKSKKSRKKARDSGK